MNDARETGMTAVPRVCFVGLMNLPVLAREYNQHGIGGEQVQQTLLAKALARRGLQVSMVVADYGQPDGASWDGIQTHRAFRLGAGVPPFAILHPRWTGIRAAASRADADIYYVSCAGIHVGQIAELARSMGRGVLFRVAHDYDCEPDKLIIQRDRLGISHFVHKRLYEYGLARADAVLVQTRKQQDAMLRNYGKDSEIATMLVDRPDAVLPWADRDIGALWVNNLRDFKRPDKLVALARTLPELSLTMVGGRQEGFDSLYDDTVAAAAALPNLEFRGQIPYHDVNQLYARARVFVNTSDTEGFPNSYLQAWVRGTPVVAYFDPDGVIAREQLGRTVRSSEEMRAAVLEFATQPASWAAASERCLAYMAREYSEERILAPYLAAIHKLAPRRAVA